MTCEYCAQFQIHPNPLTEEDHAPANCKTLRFMVPDEQDIRNSFWERFSEMSKMLGHASVHSAICEAEKLELAKSRDIKLSLSLSMFCHWARKSSVEFAVSDPFLQMQRLSQRCISMHKYVALDMTSNFFQYTDVTLEALPGLNINWARQSCQFFELMPCTLGRHTSHSEVRRSWHLGMGLRGRTGS